MTSGDMYMRAYIPVSSKEEKIPLVVQCDHLPALELWHGWKKSLEHTAYSVTKSSRKIV